MHIHVFWEWVCLAHKWPGNPFSHFSLLLTKGGWMDVKQTMISSSPQAGRLTLLINDTVEMESEGFTYRMQVGGQRKRKKWLFMEREDRWFVETSGGRMELGFWDCQEKLDNNIQIIWRVGGWNKTININVGIIIICNGYHSLAFLTTWNY